MLAALLLATAAPSPLDPAVLRHVALDSVVWKVGNGTSSALLAGDPAKPGLYVQLIKWQPGRMSRPHFHDQIRVITVLKGTWWVGTGAKYDPDHMSPMSAGTIVTHLPGGIHYDGAHEEEAIIEIVGEGPVKTTPAEKQ